MALKMRYLTEKQLQDLGVVIDYKTSTAKIDKTNKLKKTIIKNTKKSYEEIEQENLFKILALKYPLVYDLMFHIPNGGYRLYSQAKRFKKIGVKAGVSDLFLPLPKGNQHGLWIELKANKPNASVVSKAQQEWLNKMLALNYEAKVAYGANQALKIIEDYLNQ